MRRLIGALLGFVVGYPFFAVVGYFAIGMISDNHYDPSVEAAMTAMFVFGPFGAIVGSLVGAPLGKPLRVQQGKG